MISVHKYLLVIGLLVIFVFALLPGQLTPAYVVNHDKAAHALAFFMLSLMLVRAFPGWFLPARLISLALLALMIEAMQYLFVGRGFSVEDLLYDIAGALLFVMVSQSYSVFWKVFDKLSTRAR